MSPPRLLLPLLWLLLMAAAVLVLVRARYSADLSAFLPRTPSPSQQLLVEQLRDGLASRLVLIGIEGGDARARAAASLALAQALRTSGAFASVSDGAAPDAERDRAFLFAHRYVLSNAVNAARFGTDGLRAAIGARRRAAGLAGGRAGAVAARGRIRPARPCRCSIRCGGSGAPHHEQGVWSSQDGRRAAAARHDPGERHRIPTRRRVPSGHPRRVRRFGRRAAAVAAYRAAPACSPCRRARRSSARRCACRCSAAP